MGVCLEKKCVVCSAIFTTTNRLRKTCSTSCSNQLEKQRQREWEKAHPDKVKASKRKYYVTHKKDIQEYWQRRYPTIKEKLRQKRQLPEYREAYKIAFRKHHLKNRYGENALKRIHLAKGRCEKCAKFCVDSLTLKREAKFTIHHIDMNPANNDTNNLALLCDTCHRAIHKFLLREIRIHQASFIIQKFKEFAPASTSKYP